MRDVLSYAYSTSTQFGPTDVRHTKDLRKCREQGGLDGPLLLKFCKEVLSKSELTVLVPLHSRSIEVLDGQ